MSIIGIGLTYPLSHQVMTLANLITWLQERTPLSLLQPTILAALAAKLEERHLEADQILVEARQTPDGLYILCQGRLESQGGDPSSAMSFLPGSVLNLEALLLDQTAEFTLATLCPCRFWFLPRQQLQQLLQDYPGILKVFSQQLLEELKRLSFQFSVEQERQAILRPYLVPKARRGVIGRSRYAVRLRNQIREAAQNREPVLIFGEPGLEKDNLAALIHFGSDFRRDPIVQLDCSKIQASGSELFGRSGGKPGILEALGRGTLVLNNIHELAEGLLPKVVQLLKEGTYRPVSRAGEAEAELRPTQTRVILISERAMPETDAVAPRQIKVPPLRVRKADLRDNVDYYIILICRSRGIERRHATPEAIRRLQAYDFPNNLRELDSLVARAITQMTSGVLITEEIIWPAQAKKKQFRLNLLNAYPQLRRFLRSPWWPDRLNYGFTLTFFVLVVGVLWIGPQTREHNVALNLFWAWWWLLILIGFPFVGRLWCAICPFMIYGEVIQKASLHLLPRQLKSWPRQEAERWGGWFLFGLFGLILVWEEVWNLIDTAYLSACLLLLITAGAVIFSILFERRFWCRYLCPIGGMNGLFAKLSITELRAQQGTCSAECTTYQCYKGGPKKGEGLETNGCPLYSHPAQLTDNRDCVLCMTCLKACPHRSVEVNLRPPAIGLWTTHQPRSYEVALLFLLLGAVYLHRLPQLLQPVNLSWSPNGQAAQALVSVLTLAAPALIPLLAQGLQQSISLLRPGLKPRPFLELAYGYLPLVWAANLAHYLRLGLSEGGRVLPVTMATIGLSGESLPVAVAHPAVIAFLQGVALILGILLSLWVLQRIARQPLAQLWPHALGLLVITASLWKLVVGH